jgi:hypothetical protein
MGKARGAGAEVDVCANHSRSAAGCRPNGFGAIFREAMPLPRRPTHVNVGRGPDGGPAAWE